MKPFASSCINFVGVRRSDFHIGVVVFGRLRILILLPVVLFAFAILAGLPVNTRFVTHMSASFVPG